MAARARYGGKLDRGPGRRRYPRHCGLLGDGFRRSEGGNLRRELRRAARRMHAGRIPDPAGLDRRSGLQPVRRRLPERVSFHVLYVVRTRRRVPRLSGGDAPAPALGAWNARGAAGKSRAPGAGDGRGGPGRWAGERRRRARRLGFACRAREPVAALADPGEPEVVATGLRLHRDGRGGARRRTPADAGGGGYPDCGRAGRLPGPDAQARSMELRLARRTHGERRRHAGCE